MRTNTIILYLENEENLLRRRDRRLKRWGQQCCDCQENSAEAPHSLGDRSNIVNIT